MADDERKRRGAWYTPDSLVALVVDAVVDRSFVDRMGNRPVRVIDPACGDGRFLRAAADRIVALGGRADVVGIDVDSSAIGAARLVVPEARLVHADALAVDGAVSPAGTSFDLVVGNPPYLSQLASSTTRGAASRHGGGPYADAAVEFLALAASLVEREGGRVAYVLPQSILAARDGEPVRRSIDERARMIWSAWTGQRDFDADVLTCALAFEFGRAGSGRPGSWAHVVTERTGVPPVPAQLRESGGSGVEGAGTLGDRAWLNANFRDEYYGMIPAVGDHDAGPPLVTSGLIDPGRSLWGQREVRFAKRRFAAPRIDLDALDPKMRAWADRRLVPKVLVANQTPVLEAVADPGGDWLPGVPVVGIYPMAEVDVARVTGEIASVLTSPSASAWAWHERGGTGLSANTIRVGPVMLASLPWPTGDLSEAVAALRAGDVTSCGRAVDRAYGIDEDDASTLMAWWKPIVERIRSRTD